MRDIIKRILVVIFLLIVVVVVIAYFLGIFDWQNTRTQVRLGADRARTQIESTVENIGAPGGGAAGADAVENARICRRNLQRIESAKRAAAQKADITTGSVSRAAVLQDLDGKMPVCPA